jgi:hypothetical protein
MSTRVYINTFSPAVLLKNENVKVNECYACKKKSHEETERKYVEKGENNTIKNFATVTVVTILSVSLQVRLRAG